MGGAEADLEIFVGTSRDGYHWERLSRTPVIAADRDNNVWDSGNLQSVGNLFVEVGDELWLYYSGRPGGHGGAWANDRNRPSYAATGLAKLRKDGFFSIDAGDQPGVLTTRALHLPPGKLFVNLDAPGGELRVEVLDRDNRPLPGFTREDSQPLKGDGTRMQVRWAARDNLDKLTNQPVRVRFHLRQGSLYGFQVARE